MAASSSGVASAQARHVALPASYGPRNVELTARKASSPRSCAWATRSGRNRSTTSMTLPNSIVRMASRSRSSHAVSNISSTVLGGRRTSKRPSALAGASAQAMISPRPTIASRPNSSPRWPTSRSGSVWNSIGGAPASLTEPERTSGSKMGHSSKPSSA